MINIVFSSDSQKIVVTGSNGQPWLRSIEDLDALLSKSCSFFSSKT